MVENFGVEVVEELVRVLGELIEEYGVRVTVDEQGMLFEGEPEDVDGFFDELVRLGILKKPEVH